MFFGGERAGRKSRRVDLSGSGDSQAQRKQLLRDARAQRHQREQHRRRMLAAATVVTFIKSYQERREVKKQVHRALIETLAKLPNKVTWKQLRDLTRKLLFVWKPQRDAKLLKTVLLLLMASVKNANPDDNYCSLCVMEPQSFKYQVSRLCSLVFAGINLSVISSFKVAAFTSVFLLTTPDKWAIQTEDLHRHCCKQILSFVGSQSNSFQLLRNEILVQLPLPDVTDKKSVLEARNSVNVAEITLVCTLAVRLAMADSTSESSIEPSSRNFVAEIISIPMLSDRLSCFGLSAILHSIVSDHMWRKINCVCKNDILLLRKLHDNMTSSYSTHHSGLFYSALGWLLGNLLELGHTRGVDDSHMDLHIGALSEIVSMCSAVEFPPKQEDIAFDMDEGSDSSIASEPCWEDLPRRLTRQLEFFKDRQFLQGVSLRLQEGAKDLLRIERLSRLIVTLLELWPGARTDILNVIVFGSDLVFQYWNALTRTSAATDSSAFHNYSGAISVFCLSYGHLLRVLDDEDFHKLHNPFSIDQAILIVRFLKEVLIRSYWMEGQNSTKACTQLRQAAAQAFFLLRERQSRKKFSEARDWIMSPTDVSHVIRELIQVSADMARSSMQDIDFDSEQWMSAASRIDVDLTNTPGRCGLIVREVPFLLPFNDRVSLFYRSIEHHKQSLMTSSFFQFSRGLGHRARIRRSHVVEDGFSALSIIGKRIKGLVQIEFIDEHGVLEAGIDGGGLFKEFLTELCKQAFDPTFGLFLESEERFLYPNPVSQTFHELHLHYMHFLGMIIGKALFEGITIEPQFSHFFLRKLLRAPHCIDDLRSLDPDVYRNLLYLKRYEGNFDDLGLYFCVVNNEINQQEVVELVPGGSDIKVTSSNRLSFIHRLADYKLNRRTKSQCTAFLNGVSEVLELRWLRLFSADELQMLISGAQTDINVADWQHNTNYGGYDEDAATIKWFWQIVSSMSNEDKSLLLRFCTSCSRPPLLGFSAMSPKFGIQRPHGDVTALPSSSTCVNMLRLPPYTTSEMLRDKLFYAIRSNAGFDLS